MQYYEEKIVAQAEGETFRILSLLQISNSFNREIIKKFREIYLELDARTKYRSPDKLIPLVIYFLLKLRNISINQKNLLDISKISKKDFNAFKYQILRFFPEYAKRNRIAYILLKLIEVVENFELGMPFFFQAKKILFSLWKNIQNTTDEIIAGLITSISILCSNKEKIRPNHICKYFGINLSTLEYQVKKKIIKKYKISGFTSLITSSEIIKKLIFRTILGDNSPKIVEIRLGTAQKIFNKNENISYYIFALITKVKYPIYISTRNFVIRNSKKPQYSKIIILELELIRIHSSKGPPSLFTMS